MHAESRTKEAKGESYKVLKQNLQIAIKSLYGLFSDENGEGWRKNMPVKPVFGTRTTEFVLQFSTTSS